MTTGPDDVAALLGDLRQAKPDVVLVGLDLSDAAHLVTRLRAELPGAWFVESARLMDGVLGDGHPTGRSGVFSAAALFIDALTARLAGRAPHLA